MHQMRPRCNRSPRSFARIFQLFPAVKGRKSGGVRTRVSPSDKSHWINGMWWDVVHEYWDAHTSMRVDIWVMWYDFVIHIYIYGKCLGFARTRNDDGRRIIIIITIIIIIILIIIINIIIMIIKIIIIITIIIINIIIIIGGGSLIFPNIFVDLPNCM